MLVLFILRLHRYVQLPVIYMHPKLPNYSIPSYLIFCIEGLYLNIWFAEVSLQCIGSVVVNDHLPQAILQQPE